MPKPRLRQPQTPSVSIKENVLRGVGFSAVNARKTHCPQGHPYSGSNLYTNPTTGSRVCVACRRKRDAARTSRRLTRKAARHGSHRVDRARLTSSTQRTFSAALAPSRSRRSRRVRLSSRERPPRGVPRPAVPPQQDGAGILVAAWGADASGYAGRRMTLFRDPAVRFGGQDVGGIRVSHLSHIDKRLQLALTVTRGKRAPYIVEPMPQRRAVIRSLR